MKARRTKKKGKDETASAINPFPAWERTVLTRLEQDLENLIPAFAIMGWSRNQLNMLRNVVRGEIRRREGSKA